MKKQFMHWEDVSPGDILMQDMSLEPDGSIVKPRMVVGIEGTRVTLLIDSRIVSFDRAKRTNTHVQCLARH